MTVLEAITHLIEKRKSESRIPHCAMVKDVAQLMGMTESEVRGEAFKLKAQGKIALKETINSISFYLR